jgi:hypothetical protein
MESACTESNGSFAPIAVSPTARTITQKPISQSRSARQRRSVIGNGDHVPCYVEQARTNTLRTSCRDRQDPCHLGVAEGEMIDANINWGHTAPDAAPGSFRAFLLDLAEPQGVRNAIAHGLASSHSDPWSPDFEPYATCRTLDAGVRQITLGDLHRTQSQLERLRNALRGIDPLPTSAKPRR